MSQMNSIWVHGNAFVAQDPDELEAIRSRLSNPAAPPAIQHVGWGTYFRGGEGLFTWFHAPIPVPILGGILDQGLLEKVYFLYDIVNATIKNVDVYDGKKKIASFSGLYLAGNPDPINPGHASGTINGYNSIAITPHVSVHSGLGLSIGVQFNKSLDAQTPSEILFTAAGASFASLLNTLEIVKVLTP